MFAGSHTVLPSIRYHAAFTCLLPPFLPTAMLRLMVVIPLNVAYVETASGSRLRKSQEPSAGPRWTRSLLNKDAEERELSLVGLQQIDQKAHRPGEAFIQAVYTFKDPGTSLEFLGK